MEYSPYRMKKRSSTKILLLMLLVLVIAGGITFVILRSGLNKKGQNLFVGKVVELNGIVKDIGLVEQYEKDKSIVIKSVDDKFGKSIFYKLSGNYSINILANNVSEYLKNLGFALSKGKSIKQPEETKKNPEKGQKPNDPSVEIQNLGKTEKSKSQDQSIETTNLEKWNSDVDSSSEEIKLFSDEKREKGMKLFEEKVEEFAKKSDQMDIEWRRYKDACLNRYSYGSIWGRDWFGMWSGPIRVANETTPECLRIYSDFLRLAEEINKGMIEALYEARHNGLYPGFIRGIRRKYKMDWSGWER
jgi:hypothetical protein